MYAKLAWVYVKGICGFRRYVYDLTFVYVPEDKLWYIDMPSTGNRNNFVGTGRGLSIVRSSPTRIYYVRFGIRCE